MTMPWVLKYLGVAPLLVQNKKQGPSEAETKAGIREVQQGGRGAGVKAPQGFLEKPAARELSCHAAALSTIGLSNGTQEREAKSHLHPGP